MVKQNIQTVKIDRKRRVQSHAQREMAIAAAAQNTLNMVLWQIINEHAPKDEDGEDKTPGGVLTVPVEDIELVPARFALSIDPDPENGVVRIHAVVQEEKKNIVLPDGSGLNG